MNKAKLKTYAPQARKDFIAAVEARANLLGLSEKNGQLDVTPSEKKGDVALIGGQAWPAKVHEQRERLIKRIRKEGYSHTLEAVAYTWFNRFAALRYMEIHDYLGHGYRVLSSREGGLPEILTHATDVAGALPGLSAQQIADMKLAGNKDGELYRQLLVAQCNALSNAMPFLFERIDDESELLLPGNLERTDSVIAKLVEAIPEEDWNEVEVIGWLYQFYISEKKDEVIGKVVKSEDIPAATQLFTPNWIVQYLVQNSVGRLWLMANPSSSLKSQWLYYIEPAEQTTEVQAQLDALIKTRMDEDGGSLNPETITVLDPACGSGHILVEAYEVLKGIYLERGYQARAIPRLILEKNLYGLDIDDRAAQLAGFALLMKARADDRRLLDSPLKLNVLSLQESKGLDLDEFAGHLKPYGISRNSLGQLFDAFEHAKTFGSLIQIPEALDRELEVLAAGLGKANQVGDVFARAAAHDLVPLVAQASILAMKFDAVVANPPYMGGKAYCGELKKFTRDIYADARSDLFACFIERGNSLIKELGHNSMITMESWMFLSSYERFREKIIQSHTIRNLAHFPYDGKRPTVMGINFGVAVVIVNKAYIGGYIGDYCCSRYYELDDDGVPLEFPTPNERLNSVSADEFANIPGMPIAYWVTPSVRKTFTEGIPLGGIATAKPGLCTGCDERFIREWTEVSFDAIGLNCYSRQASRESGRTWFPFNKGGPFRRWFGNQNLVVNWRGDGEDLIKFSRGDGKGTRIQNTAYYFRPGITWNQTGSAVPSFRLVPPGFVFAHIGAMAFTEDEHNAGFLACLLNSCVSRRLLQVISPTMGLEVGHISSIPVRHPVTNLASIDRLVRLSSDDWNAFERAWDFKIFPLVPSSSQPVSSLESSYNAWITQNRATTAEMKRLEEHNNRLFIDAYGLSDELNSEVPLDQITLTVNPAYRYGGNLSEAEQWSRFRQDTMAELISYAIGCMMGRYSLDEPGLIYAHAGNVGFDAARYKTFPADADGIIPITDDLWFEDDAANRIREFLLAVWPAETLDENMAWLAESLGTKGNETPAETIRRYLASNFFKDHLQTYKKRPIYWLFSSGKQGAFQALVYLHRYHEGTLARMRAEYVVPLTGKMQSRIEMLEKDKDAASSTAARNKIAKQIESLKKKHVELLAYDEKLRHYADMRISLDLDDGVKVNYGKFGDLLAEVKAVTGGLGDE